MISKAVFISTVLLLTLGTKGGTLRQDNLRLIATLTGDSTGDQFSVVSGTGDVNADGFDDFVIYAPGGNYVMLLFAGPNFDTIADLREDQQSLFLFK